jgi:peroxiredoxin
MRVKAPYKSIPFATIDIYGDSLSLADFYGKRVMLSFFRDVDCPFGHLRIQELANHYTEWQAMGLDVIAVFSSTAEEVRQHVVRHPLPFRMIADPALSLYQEYGIEPYLRGFLKRLIDTLSTLAKGSFTGQRPRKRSHAKTVPADFLLEVDGTIVDLWYGLDVMDHIPFERVERFADRHTEGLSIQEYMELKHLRCENKKLKRLLQQSKLELRMDV